MDDVIQTEPVQLHWPGRAASSGPIVLPHHARTNKTRDM